jgi:hypothetical protein
MSGPASTNPLVNLFANAVAKAEGFFSPGSLPSRTNNPGDINTYTGRTTSYPTTQAGWDALTNQVELMLGGSAVYNPTMTLAQAGAIYSGGDPNWAKNVAASLGVSVNATLGQILQGTPSTVPAPPAPAMNTVPLFDLPSLVSLLPDAPSPVQLPDGSTVDASQLPVPAPTDNTGLYIALGIAGVILAVFLLS